jgi:hypothetical protein
MISDDGGKESINLFVGNLKTFSCNRVSENALPDVVVVLVEMPDNTTFVAALIPVLVLEEGDEVRDVDCYWAEGLSLVPLTLVLSDPDVA